MIHGDRKDCDLLRRHVDFLSNAIDSIGEPYGGTRPALKEHTYLDLIRRIKCSLIGVSKLLESWPEQVEVKVPISLILRTCLTDMLLLLYLGTFDNSEDSFRNELLLLDIDYIKFVKTMIENDGIAVPDSETDKDAYIKSTLDKLYAGASHLLKSATASTPKKVEEIRATSDLQLFLVAEAYKQPLSERSMYEQIKAHPDITSLSPLYLIQRYFSQHQHYSPAGRDYIQHKPRFEFIQWVKAIAGIHDTVSIAASLLSARQEVIDAINQQTAAFYEYLYTAEEE
jgi:hypothetical protein